MLSSSLLTRVIFYMIKPAGCNVVSLMTGLTMITIILTLDEACY